MTRPQKETDMKREHRITIRLTDTEFSIIENAATQAVMSISEYMRTQTMEEKVNARFEIVADVDQIKKLIGECIFRKNCASVPEERSAIPLQTEQSSAG